MMSSFTAEIEINAPVGNIWEGLADNRKHPVTHPTLRHPVAGDER